MVLIVSLVEVKQAKSRSDMKIVGRGRGLGSGTKFECFWFNNSGGMFRLNSIAFMIFK